MESVSVSPRSAITLLGPAIFLTIIAMLIHYCLTDDRCILAKPPQISRLLYITPINVRMFIMLVSFVAYSVIFFNVRVNYKRLAPFIRQKTNLRLYRLGIASMVSLPCLAVFDHHTLFWVYVGFAVTFFTSCSFYQILVTNILMHLQKIMLVMES